MRAAVLLFMVGCVEDLGGGGVGVDVITGPMRELVSCSAGTCERACADARQGAPGCTSAVHPATEVNPDPFVAPCAYGRIVDGVRGCCAPEPDADRVVFFACVGP